MKQSVKGILKKIGIIVGVFLLLIVILIAALAYEMHIKKTDVLWRESPDGQLVLKMQQIGEPAWPFGPVSGRFELKAAGKVINSLKFTVHDDGAGLEFNIPTFTWEENCVKIIVSGSEQDDMLYTLYFNGESDSEKAPMKEGTEGSTSNESTEESVETSTESSAPSSQGTLEESAEPQTTPSPEALAYYMSIEPACSFVGADGLEYRLVAVDRALGSSFHVLVGSYDGETCDFVNQDPFNGSGGEAGWITFVNKELGFACLAKSGGSYGLLYCTRDGGASFELLEYPEVKITLSNGASYNPFVMPEAVYEEDGLLYLEVGQGADGDYYGKEGFCHGLYRSLDKGVTWEFVKEISVSK